MNTDTLLSFHNALWAKYVRMPGVMWVLYCEGLRNRLLATALIHPWRGVGMGLGTRGRRILGKTMAPPDEVQP